MKSINNGYREYLDNNDKDRVVDDRAKEDPAACVFVASLNKNLDDTELCSSVYNHFQQWGNLIGVKVFKDWMKRPYAFVQYEQVSSREEALREAPGTELDGRYIRCEPARVNRSICLVALNQPFNKKDVLEIMSGYGDIEEIIILQPHGKFHSVKIKFRYRSDAIKAYTDIRFSNSNSSNYFKQHQWFVEWAAYLDNNNIYGICGSTCRLDKFTVFVGNLDESTTEEELRSLFEKHGHIVDINLVCKCIRKSSTKRTFAFIVYKNEKEASEAINHENGALFKDKLIRVCYRQFPTYHKRERHHYTKQQEAYSDITAYGQYAPGTVVVQPPYACVYDNNNKANDNMTQESFANNGYHNSLLPDNMANYVNSSYVDAYPTIVYYTYSPYSPYRVQTNYVKNVETTNFRYLGNTSATACSNNNPTTAEEHH